MFRRFGPPTFAGNLMTNLADDFLFLAKSNTSIAGNSRLAKEEEIRAGNVTGGQSPPLGSMVGELGWPWMFLGGNSPPHHAALAHKYLVF